MIWIYSVHFWDIHISPQLRVSRAWQRLLGARAGVQDYSRKRQTNEARKGYNQTHNRLKLHFYFFSLSKTTLFIVILQKSTDVFSIASHSIPHPFSWNFTVCTTSAGLNCAPKINETRCITKKKRKLFVKPLAFVDRAYPHDLINIPVYKRVKPFCQLVREQKRNLSKRSNSCQQ